MGGLVGADLAVRVASTVSPSLSAPLIARPGCVMLPAVAAAICSTVAPSGRLSSSIIWACLVPARGQRSAAPGGGGAAGAVLGAFLPLPLAGLVFARFAALGLVAGAGARPPSASADVGAVGSRQRLVAVRLDADRGHSLRW